MNHFISYKLEKNPIVGYFLILVSQVFFDDQHDTISQYGGH
jgi:hypothetical protein